jgi:predicted dienelactone hydrolase
MRTASISLALLTCALVACGSEPRGSDDAGATTLPDVSVQTDTSLPDPDALSESDTTSSDTVNADTVETQDTVSTPDAAPADVITADTTSPDTSVTPDVTGEDTTVIPDGPVDPYEDGIYRFSTRTVRVPLAGGGEVDAALYVPVSADVPSFPAVVFGHGFQLTGASYTDYAERMASHGLIVLLPTWGDGLFSARTHTQLAADVEAMVNWLIAENESGGEFAGVLDVDSIGMSGHSRGGKTAIFGAINDERVEAVFVLDPVDSGPPFGSNPTDYPSLTPERMADLRVPLGIVGAGKGSQASFGQACAPAADNYQAYYDAASTPSSLYVVADAGHNDFLFSCSGLQCNICPGGGDAAFMRTLSSALLVSFMRYYLADDARYQPFLSGGVLEDYVRAGDLQYRSR